MTKPKAFHRPISIAYSPDTDDAFMVHAMRSGLVNTMGYEFIYTSADIQELNESAKHGTFDVTAISIAAYPELQDDYFLMPIGASIGDAFGPAIIVRGDSAVQTPKDLQGMRIAVPGLRTSAYFAARGLIGAFTPVPLPFHAIAEAVNSGTVDAGILIHELQLECENQGFRKLGDLGRLWADAFNLPLPLGGNAIKRELGADAIRDVTAIMRASIEVGLATREATLKAALSQSGADLDLQGGDRYISMYVNHRSLSFAADVREAMTRLFAFGHEAGMARAFDAAAAHYE